MVSVLNSDLNYSASGEFTTNASCNLNSISCKGYVVNFAIRSTDCSFTGTSDVIATIPEEFRPMTTVYFQGHAYYNDAYNPVFFRIYANGNLTQFTTNNTFTRFMVAGSFPI